jgi:two-component sensor histidine kinase
MTTLLLAVVLGLAALMVWQGYRAALSTAEARAQSAAQIVAAHVEFMMTASDQALRRIDAAVGDNPVRSTADTIADIAQAVGDLPAGFRFTVYDAGGHVRLDSDSAAAGSDVPDKDYFRELREGAAMVISRDARAESPFLVIARRMARDGRFTGVASIAIPGSRLDMLWRSLNLGALSTVSIIRSDGWVVARHPDLDTPVDLSKSRLFVDLLPEKSDGIYHSAASAADGVSRVVGFSRVRGWPLVAVAGIEQGAALAGFRAGLETLLAFGVPLIAILIAGTVWIARLLAADEARRTALEAALERNRFLFREIHHRVKNNLQTVSSLVRLQPLPKEVRDDMGRRIAAMVAVHEHIYQSDQFDRVEMSGYVARLLREIAAGYDQDVEIDARLSPLTVSRDQALPVGLIVNEVVSNAFKHAFSAGTPGRLEVEMDEGDDATGRLTITDNGPGRRTDDEHKGMGSSLVAGFVAQLGGHHSFENNAGTVFSMTFPIR